MTSIFSLRCVRCDGILEPRWGALWTCDTCDQTFEVCGQVLVAVMTDDERFGHHAPVAADGISNTGNLVTEPRSPISSP